MSYFIFVLTCVIFLLCTLVSLLIFIILKIVQNEKKALYEYDIVDNETYKDALRLKEIIKKNVLAAFTETKTKSNKDIWAWSMALKEIIVEINERDDNS